MATDKKSAGSDEDLIEFLPETRQENNLLSEQVLELVLPSSTTETIDEIEEDTIVISTQSSNTNTDVDNEMFDEDAVIISSLSLHGDQSTGLKTGYVYEEVMQKHAQIATDHLECPGRIKRSYELLQQRGILERCTKVKGRAATDEELEVLHTVEHRKNMDSVVLKSNEELIAMSQSYQSIYLNQYSSLSARHAVGCLLEITEAVMTNKIRNGLAVIRPPGHHAESHCAMGFCVYNNVALAAHAARNKYGAERVLIVDWDVHHGNGTQRMFEEDDSVLYFSVHRYDGGKFYPASPYASPKSIGVGRGKGYSVNVGWNGPTAGDLEYLMVWNQILMPIAYGFNPDLVIVSAGFDAARGDPLGGCEVSPEGYAQLTHMLSGLANGRVIIALEGGYNITSVSESLSACAEVLTTKVPPRLELTTSRKFATHVNAMRETAEALHTIWPVLAPLKQTKSRGRPKLNATDQQSKSTRPQRFASTNSESSAMDISDRESSISPDSVTDSSGGDYSMPRHVLLDSTKNTPVPVRKSKRRAAQKNKGSKHAIDTIAEQENIPCV
eukprot:m.82630 g.82630  ORF g.82630 m.82630 type:complete len:555 (+) comp12880_c1_seq1:31-1695(+)